MFHLLPYGIYHTAIWHKRQSWRAAFRADTAQSVVARIELGQTSPTWDTLARLVEAAGFDLDVDVTLAPVDGSHMLADVPRILGLSPENRLRELANLDRLVRSARRVS